MKDISKNYIQIQGWMITDLKLSGNELLAYSLIYGFSQDGQSEFTGSLNYVCQWLSISRPTAIKTLKSLVEKKLIIKTQTEVNNVTFNRYKISLRVVKKLNGGSKETLQGGSKNSLRGGSKETLPNNNNINNTNLDNTKYKSASAKKFTKKEFKKVLLDLDCESELIDDWFKVRDKKKAVYSKTSLKAFINECNKNNYPVSSAVKKCAENSWKGFKYEWLNNTKDEKRNSSQSGVQYSDAFKERLLKKLQS